MSPTYRTHIKPHLPAPLRRSLTQGRGWLRHLRVRTWATRLLGPAWTRSRDLLEIDLTYACNLSCHNCNRSVTQAPTTAHIRRADLQGHIEQWIARGKAWRRIRLLGGEPTLHPEFAAIVTDLRAWRDAHSPGTVIEVATNGHGKAVERRLAALPGDIVIDNTMKEGPEQPFLPFNMAPVDDPSQQHADYRSGCWVTEHCGTGLTPTGYYPCAVAGGMDRVLGRDLGRAVLPSDDDDMRDELDAFCRMCGLFDTRPRPVATRPVASRSWTAAYDAWRARGTDTRPGTD